MYLFPLQHLECFIGFKNHRWCELAPRTYKDGACSSHKNQRRYLVVGTSYKRHANRESYIPK